MRFALFIFVLVTVSSLIVSAQSSDFLSKLDTRFREHVNKSPRTHIEAFFNQNKYTPGDSVFFSVRYLYENKTIVPGSDILYLDVVSATLEVKHRIRFRVKDGVGYNQFRLPEDLESGIYRFYLYSEWMKNFGAEAFFYFSVPITGKNRVSHGVDANYQFLVFPEGGNLINEIENSVSILGSPGEVVFIKDNNGVLLESVKINDSGVGNFVFVPKQGYTYCAEYREGKVNFKGNNDGIAFHLNDKDELFVEASVPPNSIWQNKAVYLVIVAEDEIVFKSRVRVNSGKLQISLPQFDNPNTLHYIYLLNESGQELAQRLFVPRNKDEIKVNIKLLPEIMQRQAYTLGVGFSTFDNSTLSADFSISITQKDLFENNTNVPTYLQRAGKAFEWAVRNFKNYSEFLNQFLATQKTDRFNWSDIYKGIEKPQKHGFRSEMAIRGKIVSRINQKSAPDSIHVLAYLQKNLIGYETFAINGKFKLSLPFDFWDDDKVFMTLRYRNRNVDSEYEIQIHEDSIIFDNRWNSNSLNTPDSYASYKSKQALIDQSYLYFVKDSGETSKEGLPNDLFESEFPEVDNTIKISNYKIFPNMDELLKEVVTFIQLKRRGEGSTARLFYRYDKSLNFYEQDPLYIIDGVMTTDTKFFLNLTPENLISIKAISNPNKLAQLGALGRFGVVFVESKSGSSGKKLGNNLFPVTGLIKPKQLTEATWIKNKSSNIPVLKSTVYWNPIAKSSTRFFETTFFATDDLGVMKIVIQGNTENGERIYSETEFKVKENPDRN